MALSIILSLILINNIMFVKPVSLNRFSLVA